VNDRPNICHPERSEGSRSSMSINVVHYNMPHLWGYENYDASTDPCILPIEIAYAFLKSLDH